MVRKGRARRLKLEAFGRAHLKGWGYSNLNQREYCERHGLPLKRFGNWRAEFKNEQTIVPEGLLWRRGGGDCTGASNKTREILPPPLRRRRNYSDADKNRRAFPSCLIGSRDRARSEDNRNQRLRVEPHTTPTSVQLAESRAREVQ